MLPDFPETKKLFTRFFQAYMREKVREISPYSVVQSRYLHEGRDMKITRADQSESNSSLKQLSAPMELKFEEIETMTFRQAIERHDALVLELVRQQTNMVRERMGQEIPDSQTVNAAKRGFSPQIVMEVLERIQMEFYPDGTPHEIFIDAPSISREKISAVYESILNNPELKKQYDELLEKKREEWRAREAGRKLVG